MSIEATVGTPLSRSSLVALEARTTVPLLVAFADLTRYSAESLRVEDDQVATTMNGFYGLVEPRVTGAGGIVVKFMGDAALIVFPEAAADDGVLALLELKEEVDAYFAAIDWACRLVVKVHFGPVVAGPFGALGARRFDVLGRAVNAAAMLDSTGVALSVSAFRSVGPAVRERFKKHTPPVTYIRSQDPHTLRRR